jgi:SnoaL-like polyketide cyclase
MKWMQRDSPVAPVRSAAAERTDEMNDVVLGHGHRQPHRFASVDEDPDVLADALLLVDHAEAHTGETRFEIGERFAHRAERDLVVVHRTSGGTNTGAGRGFPMKGRAVLVTGTTLFRMADGRIAEE